MFCGIIAFFVENGVQNRRLQIWKKKLEQMEALVEERFSKKVTHVFAKDLDSLLQKFDRRQLERLKARVLLYQWLEDSLKEGKRVSEDTYVISLEPSEQELQNTSWDPHTKDADGSHSESSHAIQSKKLRQSSEPIKSACSENSKPDTDNQESQATGSGSYHSALSHSPEITSPFTSDAKHETVGNSNSSLYNPPDFNRNITEIFKRLIDIYRALGDDRRSFSYYKAIPVIEKFPFKIESAEQVKNLPGIGKSLQDHIQEIITTGKLSKLEHFENDEKVRTISLFGEVWGIGPATALKLFEKGHRTLNDLEKDESLTHAQRIGLKYFDDIKTRIPRHEVQEMEQLLQRVGEEILSGVNIVCGGSYRRGKDTCGDMDIVITHPDGKSHVGFLSKFVKHLKDMKFLREDLIFSVHSEEGTDHGVDTYFGLCTYSGRELRHRIDLKVYPRDIYAFGLIAWTGNDVLNRRLRLLAESKGFRLDDTGLFPAIQSSSNKRGGKGSASLKFHTEKEVFDFLGFPWLEPHERNLFKFLAGVPAENFCFRDI
ncbi:DNA-directed DNA polymerase [Lithospermum erythrorhizon]|uniref:DNA polymerase n=1 Tax=Lithospermum erythrorhizon TaxID=34254 RepID=A0AAV3R290_LITER